MGEVMVEFKNITKTFPGVVALDNMSIQLKKGEVHGLIGENGAGKSTLIKTLTGVVSPDEGDILVEGKKVSFSGPSESRDNGIACVYQELNIVGDLSITDNMFVGNYVKRKSGFLDYKYMHKKAKEIMKSMEQDIEPTELCGNLGMGQQQMVEIGKAILTNAKIIILDEPTSSLGEKEAAELFRTVNILKNQGITLLFVSHKLEEIFFLCDDVTVMRDGKHIITEHSSKMTKDDLISHMVGREIGNLFPKQETTRGDIALEVKNMTRVGEYYDISFKAYKGQILGFAGLVGAGRTELMRGIFAADLPDSGEIFVNGKEVQNKTAQDAIKNGIAFLTEDRKGQGLVLPESIEKNLTLVNALSLRKGIFMDDKRIRKQADDCIDKLQIRTPSASKAVGELSGGNQQKVVIGKWINTGADIYIFDEPTRGIDVGAKLEVYKVMNDLISQGKCVIMVSSELNEIIGMCDSVVVMREGKKMAEVERDSKWFNQEDIMRAAWGGKLDEN